MRKQIPLYATQADWASLLAAASSHAALTLVKAGDVDEPLSLIGHFDALGEGGYLLVSSEEKIQIRIIDLANGSVRHVVDQLANPNSLALTIGSWTVPDRLIASAIGTASASDQSTSLMKLMDNELRRQFSMVRSYRVGSDAMRLLNLGIRLTPTAKSSPEYDLKL